jgi:hypothetical protein
VIIEIKVEVARIKRAFGRRAEPLVVIEAGGRFGIGRIAHVGVRAFQAPTIPGTHEADLAKLAGFNAVYGLDPGWAAALLGAELHHPVVFPRRLHHDPAFPDVVTERFFHINILASLAGLDGGNGVPMIGRGNYDRIHVFEFEQLAVILEDPEFRQGLLGTVELLLRGVGAGDHAHVVHFHELFKMIKTASTQADEAEPDFFIGAQHLEGGRGGERGAESQGFARSSDKFPAINRRGCVHKAARLTDCSWRNNRN